MIARHRLLEQRISRHFATRVQLWRGDAASAGQGSQHVFRRLYRHARPKHLAQPLRCASRDRSLTHAGKRMYAITAGHTSLNGIGIDFEPWRVLDSRHARMMLTPQERLRAQQASNEDLLRIWTIKEALFKADMGGQQRWVNAYELECPLRRSGIGKVQSNGRIKRFRYLSIRTTEGILSTAFALGVGRNARQ